MALSEDDIALAGEYALGLLDRAAEAGAAARIATDPAFAVEIEAWRNRLQPLLDGADETPREELWRRIAGALPKASGQDQDGRALRRWKSVSFASMGLAAALAALLLVRPVTPPLPDPPPAQAPLVAALSGPQGAVSLTASYDAATGQLLITPVRLETGERVPELWVVPGDGVARSLGIMRANAPTRVTVPSALRPHLHTGVTLAITPEPVGGAPGGKATGPIVASGTIVTA